MFAACSRNIDSVPASTIRLPSTSSEINGSAALSSLSAKQAQNTTEQATSPRISRENQG